MYGGRRSHVVNQAARASSTWHYYRPQRRHSPIFLPPRKVRDLAESIDPETRAAVSEAGLQIAEAIDKSKPLDEQLDIAAAIVRERFEAIVAPLVESMKDAIDAAVGDVVGQADQEPGLPDVKDEQDARGWIAATVILVVAAGSGAAIGADVGQGKYAEAAKWAIGMLVALVALFRQKP